MVYDIEMLKRFYASYAVHVDGKPKKPDPTVPRELIASLGVLPDECVCISL